MLPEQTYCLNFSRKLHDSSCCCLASKHPMYARSNCQYARHILMYARAHIIITLTSFGYFLHRIKGTIRKYCQSCTLEVFWLPIVQLLSSVHECSCSIIISMLYPWVKICVSAHGVPAFQDVIWHARQSQL